MKFFDYTETERREWRENAITKAYLERLKDESEVCATDALRICMKHDAIGYTANYAGKSEAFADAVRIATTVTSK